MRIGIDLHMVNDFMQGSRTYTYNLTKSLIENDRENDYFLYFSEIPKKLPDIFTRSNVHVRSIWPKSRIVRLPISFPIRLLIDRIDLFHCQYMAPPLMPTPYVVTLHDIIHESHPEYYPKMLRYFMSMFYPYCARRASHVFTVSQYSMQEIINRYGIPDRKISVTYNGVSDEFRVIDDYAAIRKICKRYGIPHKYILFVGRLEPRKNIAGLIRAFHILRQRQSVEHKLVIAGMKDFSYESLFELVQELGLTDQVIFTGRVEQDDLPYLYNGASFFVYPTFAEGFGIPPLEAMACGTPVIASNTTSLPEVVGSAGIQVDPHDHDALVQAMATLLTNTHLTSELHDKGIEQAKKFTWIEAAQQVIKIYREIGPT